MSVYCRSPHKRVCRGGKAMLVFAISLDFVVLCSVCQVFKFKISCDYFHSKQITFRFNSGFVIFLSSP